GGRSGQNAPRGGARLSNSHDLEEVLEQGVVDDDDSACRLTVARRRRASCDIAADRRHPFEQVSERLDLTVLCGPNVVDLAFARICSGLIDAAVSHHSVLRADRARDGLELPADAPHQSDPSLDLVAWLEVPDEDVLVRRAEPVNAAG